VDAIEYPVIWLEGPVIGVASAEEELATCTRTALRKGFFVNRPLIDSTGRVRKIRTATKIGSAGHLPGYFLIRLIRVRLEFSDVERTLSVGEVRDLVRDSFKRWQGWNSRGDFPELKKSVDAAKSIRELIQVLQSGKKEVVGSR
jgi:hypothetical protein